MVPRQHKGIEVLTNKFIATCQSANVPIYVWVVNDPHEMLELFDLGISGVVTDCYEKMLGNIKH
jgi:glycerophosphoryl diester phosphodiesterase